MSYFTLHCPHVTAFMLLPPTCSPCQFDIQGIPLHLRELLWPAFFIKSFLDGCLCPTHGWASQHDEFFRKKLAYNIPGQPICFILLKPWISVTGLAKTKESFRWSFSLLSLTTAYTQAMSASS